LLIKAGNIFLGKIDLLIRLPTSISRHPMLSVGVALIVIFPLFFIGGPTFYSAPLFRALWDCGHIIFFSCLIFALHQKVTIAGWRPFLAITAVVFVLGGAIEVIQTQTGRYGSWQDLLNDLVGTWLGLFWLQKSNLWVWLGRVSAIALASPNVVLVLLAAWSQIQSEYQFPELANFESAISLHGWKGNIERTNLLQSSGNYSLKIHLNTEKYAGVSLTEFYNSWQGYTNLSLDLYNPEHELVNLVIRISDVQHELSKNDHSDRFNKKIAIKNGWNHIEISVAEIRQAPLTRTLEMDNITSMIIFATQLQQSQDIYMDNVRLR
jgi:hypothetical protein